jgi:hypothetical protein
LGVGCRREFISGLVYVKGLAMYVSSTAPLPQNSLMPPPAWQVNASKREMARLNWQVARALMSYECGLNPQGYAEFGPAVVGQVAQANNLLTVSGAAPTNLSSVLSGGPGTAQNLQQMADSTISTPVDTSPPQVIPFNPVQMMAPPLNPPQRNPLNMSAPSWNDSWVSSQKPCNTLQDWISQNPGTTLLIGGALVAGLAAMSQKKRGRRG